MAGGHFFGLWLGSAIDDPGPITDLERDALYASMEVALGLRPPITPLRREVLPARRVAWWRRLVPRLRSHRRARPRLTHGGPDATKR